MKIGIVEDNATHASERYAHLLSNHEVHLLYDCDSDIFEHSANHLKALGFTNTYSLRSQIPEGLDVYFLDGLEGKCFLIMDALSLPKDRAFIVSLHTGVNETAKSQGYNRLSELDISKKVEELEKNLILQ